MRWFEASLRRATPKCQDPSSPAQHRIKDPSYIGPSLHSGHTLAPHTSTNTPRWDCNLNGVTPETEETPVTDVTTSESRGQAELPAADEQVLRELTERARAGGLRLTGEGGLLGKLTKMVVEGALEGELGDHLGYEKNDPAGRDGGNSRNGYRAKTVLTDTGPVEISVPRDRDSTFEPKIVAKRQRRLTGVDEMVISLSAKGLTHGEICG